MLTTPVEQNNRQTELLKNMVPDPEWFNRDKMKFKNWQREIRLFLKINRVIEIDDRITMILAHLRRNIADIYAQKKLNELDEEIETQDWDEFI